MRNRMCFREKLEKHRTPECVKTNIAEEMLKLYLCGVVDVQSALKWPTAIPEENIYFSKELLWNLGYTVPSYPGFFIPEISKFGIFVRQ